jgi:hypothetical protein
MSSHLVDAMIAIVGTVSPAATRCCWMCHPRVAIGEVADGLDGRCRVTAFEKQRSGRGHNGSPSEAGAGLPTLPLDRLVGLDIIRHTYDSITLNSRVPLSFRTKQSGDAMANTTTTKSPRSPTRSRS